MDVVVVGAKGWAGRSVISVLRQSLRIQKGELQLFGREDAQLSILDEVHEVRRWQSTPKIKCDLFLPVAFPTVDKARNFSLSQYRGQCLELIEKASRFIEVNRPERCILLSSGIVGLSEDVLVRDKSYFAYKAMKMREEQELADACLQSGTKLLVCRVFSVSGRHIQAPENYALGNFILQGFRDGEIKVNAQGDVWRRYLDFEDLLQVLIKESLVQAQPHALVESGGTLVEMGNLALKVAQQLNIVQVFRTRNPQSPTDNYFSRHDDIEKAATLHGIACKSIEDQIRTSISALTNTFGSSGGTNI